MLLVVAALRDDKILMPRLRWPAPTPFVAVMLYFASASAAICAAQRSDRRRYSALYTPLRDLRAARSYARSARYAAVRGARRCSITICRR